MTKRLPQHMLPLLLLLFVPAILPAQLTVQDSLELQLLDLDIQKARLTAAHTDFWHRLLSHVNFTASLGVKEIFFIDPNTSLPYLLPRDAYRLTLVLPISEILFDNSQHSLAELQIAQLQLQHARLLDQQEGTRQLIRQKLVVLDAEHQLLRDQIRMSEDIVRFRQLLFDQGKLHYDVLIRSQLDLLDARKSLNRLNVQHAELEQQVRPLDSAVGRDSGSGAGTTP